MGLEDIDSHKLWSQLSQSLDELKTINTIDVKLIDELFLNKSIELNDLVKNIKKSKKESEKMRLELECVDRAIEKANNNISKAENKSQDIQEYIEKMSKKLNENKENVENVMNVWNTIGLRIVKMDQLFDIKFNKISESDPNKWFSIRIRIEDDKRIKVVECEPKDSIDSKLIEDEFNANTDRSKPDLRHLIAFVRNNLKKNKSK